MSLPSKLTIDVTDEDIAKGDHSAFSCPVSLATTRAMGIEHLGKRQNPDGTHPSGCSGGDILVYDKNNKSATYSLPTLAMDWVSAYDKGLPVKPISFVSELERIHLES
jgi:hypothetical protein